MAIWEWPFGIGLLGLAFWDFDTGDVTLAMRHWPCGIRHSASAHLGLGHLALAFRNWPFGIGHVVLGMGRRYTWY